VKERFEQAQVRAESWSPEEVLQWGFATFGDRIEMATGFGAEGMVLLDIALHVNPKLRVFSTDTGFLFPETYELKKRVEERYGIRIERLQSKLTPEKQAEIHGLELWKRNPDQCCSLRKVEPLREKLSTLHAWITAIRREQTAVRANAPKIGWDEKFGLVKLSPIAGLQLAQKEQAQNVVEVSVGQHSANDRRLAGSIPGMELRSCFDLRAQVG